MTRRDAVAHAKTPSDIVAEQIAYYRRKRGWDLAGFAAACADAGADLLTTDVLVNIEGGQRNDRGKRQREITIDELLVLAYVLAVPPTLLIVPLGTDHETAILHEVKVDPDLVLRWLEGIDPPRTAGGEIRDAEAWTELAKPLNLYRKAPSAPPKDNSDDSEDFDIGGEG